MKTLPAFAPHSSSAALAIVSNTGCTSVCDRLITRRISEVAVCCSRDSVRSRLRWSRAVNSRTFSIAMTAWSANVASSAIWASVNGFTSERQTPIEPIARPSRRSGTASTVRAPTRVPGASRYCGSAPRSGVCTTRHSSAARPDTVSGPIRRG